MLSLLCNKEVFPTKWSLAIFVAYMALFVSQGLLVTASRQGQQTYPYNPTTVVLLTEMLKLILSSAAYVNEHSVIKLLEQISQHSAVLAYYMIPAFLYCLYNNLSFTNLVFFDPTTYFMFMQIRLLMTGVIYQFLFKRKLSSMQWFSLLLVTIGCMIQKWDVTSMSLFVSSSAQSTHPVALAQAADAAVTVAAAPSNVTLAKPAITHPSQSQGIEPWELLSLSTGFIFIMIQVCCSVFAGVYNEYLIKHVAGNDVHIMVQNVFMYLDSIVCNLIVLGFKGDLGTAFSYTSLQSIFAQVLVLFIILNNSLVGIVTSLFLKNLNSILKAFASAMELVFTAILSFLLLAIPIYWNTILAVGVVSYAVVVYAQNPVKNERSTSAASTTMSAAAAAAASTGAIKKRSRERVIHLDAQQQREECPRLMDEDMV